MGEPHKKIAIVQSNYIPWKGYFDLIAAVDEFILYDDMQYTRSDWRNRNQIKTSQGLQWLTVPVKVKGEYYQTIRQTGIEGTRLGQVALEVAMPELSPRKSFPCSSSGTRASLPSNEYSHLSKLNRTLIEWVCSKSGITTTISNSWDYQLAHGKTERLADLCCQAGARNTFSALARVDISMKASSPEKGISSPGLIIIGYPEYPQRWGDFTHNVSILDLLFNCGHEAQRYMRYVRT